jgi:hypothetical protein
MDHERHHGEELAQVVASATPIRAILDALMWMQPDLPGVE